MVAKGSAILAAVAGTVIASSAMAVTDGPHAATYSITSKATNFDTSTELAFPKFDPSLGYLTKITLTIDASMRTNLMATAITDSTKVYTQASLDLWVQDPQNRLQGDPLPLVEPNTSAPLLSLVVNTSANKRTITAGNSYTWSNLTDSASATYDYYGAGVFAEFTGTGNLFFRALTQTDTGVFWSSGNATASQSTTASVTGTVTYEYSAVPEAGTMLLGGCALMPILGLRRRSRRA